MLMIVAILPNVIGMNVAMGQDALIAAVLKSTPHVQEIGPLKVSQVNPRYFADGQGKVTYLTGSHTWDNFGDWGASTPDFDYLAYLAFLRTNNHNFIRLWMHESIRLDSEVETSIAPLPWERPGPGLANDGRPKIDLEKFNPAFFERLRRRAIEAGTQGIYISIMLFNRYLHWPTHPLNSMNNINGIDGDLNGDGDGREIHTLAIPLITHLQKAYAKKVIDTVNDLDNVLYEIGNELRRDTVEWQYEMINFIHDYERNMPKQHAVGMTSTGGGSEPMANAELFQSPADWISPRTERGQNYSFDPPAADGNKVIITDTDHLSRILEYPTPQWVWKSFLRGLNPILMDVIQNRAPGVETKWNDPSRPSLSHTRKAMGHTLAYARRINLANMVPRPDLSSTKYCLADLRAEYLIYIPSAGVVRGRGNRALHWLSDFSHGNKLLRQAFEVVGLNETVTVDLSQASGEFNVEWFNPIPGETIIAPKTFGGARQKFTAPFPGDAVLYIHRS
jgi:Family of unknown function (DUF6298)